jgi:N-acetylglucosaminyl-diphospho-decaprenol L-rhamnosyltransferase
MKLLAVVINYRTAKLTIEALRHLVAELSRIPDSSAVVVDNASGDGSFELLREAVASEGWADRVAVVASERNRGFAGGINFALEPAFAGCDPPDTVYLLNSDAFVAPGAVELLLAFLERNPEVGICGSYIHGTDATPHETAFRFPTILSEFIARVPLWPFTPLLRRFAVALPIPTRPQPVDWLAGASMMIRRSVLDSIGLFDEEFFLYYEETDFCLRARRAGFPTWYVPESRVAHVGSASTGIQDASRPRPGYWFESRRHYLRKHHGLLYLWLANVVWVVGFAAWQLRRRVKGLPNPDPPHLLRDFLRHNILSSRTPGRTITGTRPAGSS